MGVVYRAEDERLRRLVALKVLPEKVVGNQERRRRFLREAQAAAAVTHPSIAAIYEIGEDAGKIFLAMEYLEGSTLREVIQQGQMTPAGALRVAIDIARGLERAHRAGVVHRDLKPDNIMVQPDGRAKILDFGLAKLRQDRAAAEESQDSGSQPGDLDGSPASSLVTRAAEITRRGVVMGTSGYMSPEQACGKAVDARSDLFSLGVLLYEMLTGRNPFAGPSIIETLSAILKDRPAPVSTLNPSVPAPVARVVDRLLAKSPAQRFASATEFLEALDAMRDASPAAGPPRDFPSSAGAGPAAAAARPRTSIAVLPFANMSADSEQEYFCDGMAEELINALTKIKGLRVAARSSAFQFKDKATDIRRIGEALNVATVLEGSVRKAGRRLRVTAQLIQTADGYHIWSERYDRHLEDIFDLQDEITAMIVEALATRLGVPETTRRPGLRPTQNVEAYNLYLKGRYHWHHRYAGGLQKAIRCFEQAIARDPGYARPYAALADVYAILGIYGFISPEVSASRSRESFQRALALDPSLSEAHTARGFHLFFSAWKWQESAAALRMALELDPDSVQAHCWSGLTLCFRARPDQGLPLVLRATALDPLSPYAHAIKGFAFLATRRDQEAIGALREALEYDASHLLALYLLGLCLVRTGQQTEGLEVLEKSLDLSGRASYYLALTGWARARGGDREAARSILDELAGRSKTGYVAPVCHAWILAGLGEPDAAFQWLEQAYQARDPFLPAQEGSPPLDPLRGDPRYAALLEKIG